MEEFELLRLIENVSKVYLTKWISDNIYGRCSMPEEDSYLLTTIASLCMGDHIEIGVCHGGSAIACAYAKRLTQADGHIYGIDPLNGYDDASRTPHPPPPTMDAVVKNIELHGMEDNISIYQGYHPPLPPELLGMRFASAFIDGDHTFQSVNADWFALKDKIDGVVVFHDIGKMNFGCGTVFEIAIRDPEWELLYRGNGIGAVKRPDYTLRLREELPMFKKPPVKEDEEISDEKVPTEPEE